MNLIHIEFFGIRCLQSGHLPMYFLRIRDFNGTAIASILSTFVFHLFADLGFCLQFGVWSIDPMSKMNSLLYFHSSFKLLITTQYFAQYIIWLVHYERLIRTCSTWTEIISLFALLWYLAEPHQFLIPVAWRERGTLKCWSPAAEEIKGRDAAIISWWILLNSPFQDETARSIRPLMTFPLLVLCAEKEEKKKIK